MQLSPFGLSVFRRIAGGQLSFWGCRSGFRRFDVSINYLLSAFGLPSFRRVAGDQLNHQFVTTFWGVFAYAEIAVELELRPVVCEKRQMNR